MDRLEIDSAIDKAKTQLVNTFSFTESLINSINIYEESFDIAEECDSKLKEYFLEMSVMATAIQYSVEMTRNNIKEER